MLIPLRPSTEELPGQVNWTVRSVSADTQGQTVAVLPTNNKDWLYTLNNHQEIEHADPHFGKHIQGRPSPKPMMHIAPYFKKIYKFPPISAKLIVSSYNCSSYGSCLIYVFASPYLIRESKNVINQSILNKRILTDWLRFCFPLFWP